MGLSGLGSFQSLHFRKCGHHYKLRLYGKGESQMDFLRNVFGKIRKGSVSTESTHPAITTPENASRAAPTDDIPKSLAVLENAYLVRHDEDLEKRVKDALDGVSATGEAGINVLLERLYRDMQITGSHLQVQFGGDLAWN